VEAHTITEEKGCGGAALPLADYQVIHVVQTLLSVLLMLATRVNSTGR
jgi:hypothetical protein